MVNGDKASLPPLSKHERVPWRAARAAGGAWPGRGPPARREPSSLAGRIS